MLKERRQREEEKIKQLQKLPIENKDKMVKALGLETLKDSNKYLPLFNKKLSQNQQIFLPPALESPKSHIILPPLETAKSKEKTLSPILSPKES